MQSDPRIENDVYDLVVIGAGIAGTSVALTAARRGLRVAWVHQEPLPDMQSLHWHGYLHRGHLYDSGSEATLIRTLGDTVRYWDQPALADFVHETPGLILRAGSPTTVSSERPWGTAAEMRVVASLRKGVTASSSDERTLDGPRYLAAAWNACMTLTRRFIGTCTEVRPANTATGTVASVISGNDGDRELRSHKTIIAAGIDPHRLSPDWSVSRRMSRMLVMHGQLPDVSVIAPGPSFGGLFVVPREPVGDVATTWLVSDAYSSPLENRSEFLDGWWACSVIDRLRSLVTDDLIGGTTVAAYGAPKSALRSHARKVSAHSSSINSLGTVATFSPSKWTLAPTAAVHLVAQMFPETGRAAVDELAGLAELIATQGGRNMATPSERWQHSSTQRPLSDLLVPGARTLSAAAQLFKSPSVEPGAVHA